MPSAHHPGRSRRVLAALGATALALVCLPAASLAGPGGSAPQKLTALGSKVLFTADDGVHGRELWVSDGSPAGTFLLKDLDPGTGSFIPQIVVAGANAYLVQFDSFDWNLVRTNGTRGGTVSVTSALHEPRELVSMGATLFFLADTPAHGTELWRSDGTGPGTKRVTAIGDASEGVQEETLTRVGSRLFFGGDGEGPGVGLYRSSGAPGAFLRLRGFPNAVDGLSHLTAAGSLLFFVVQAPAGTWSLWKSDGSPSGTLKVRTLPAEPDEVAAVGARLFLAVGSAATGRELWKSDGTQGSTTLVRNIYPGDRGSFPVQLVRFGARLAFVADSNNGTEDDIELWVSDGTGPGTVMLKDINPDGPSQPYDLRTIGGVLWFRANDGISGTEPWSSGPGGTNRRANIAPGDDPSTPGDFTKAGSFVYFAADDGSHGRELWRTTSAGGATQVEDIR